MISRFNQHYESVVALSSIYPEWSGYILMWLWFACVYFSNMTSKDAFYIWIYCQISTASSEWQENDSGFSPVSTTHHLFVHELSPTTRQLSRHARLKQKAVFCLIPQSNNCYHTSCALSNAAKDTDTKIPLYYVRIQKWEKDIALKRT